MLLSNLCLNLVRYGRSTTSELGLSLQVGSGTRISLNGLYKGPLVFKSGYQTLRKSLELLNYTHTPPIPLEVYPNSGNYPYSTNIAVLYEGIFPDVFQRGRGKSGYNPREKKLFGSETLSSFNAII